MCGPKLNGVCRKPSIGRYVRSFQNATRSFNYFVVPDATREDYNDELLTSAAKNLKMLRKAEFDENLIASVILDNIELYPHLEDLNLHGLSPMKYAWSNISPILTRLNWKIPIKCWKERPWTSARLILIMAESTCPNLVSLDISYLDDHGRVRPFHWGTATAMPQEYPDFVMTGPTLNRLQHFGFVENCGQLPDPLQDAEVAISTLGFLNRYRETLTSWTTFIGNMGSRQNLDKVIQGCEKLHLLTCLVVHARRTLEVNEPHIALSHLQTLISTITRTNPRLERFSMTTIETPFTSMTGMLFKAWQHLKFLRLGDGDNTKGPFRSNGRPDFKKNKLVSGSTL